MTQQDHTIALNSVARPWRVGQFEQRVTPLLLSKISDVTSMDAGYSDTQGGASATRRLTDILLTRGVLERPTDAPYEALKVTSSSQAAWVHAFDESKSQGFQAWVESVEGVSSRGEGRNARRAFRVAKIIASSSRGAHMADNASGRVIRVDNTTLSTDVERFSSPDEWSTTSDQLLARLVNRHLGPLFEVGEVNHIQLGLRFSEACAADGNVTIASGESVEASRNMAARVAIQRLAAKICSSSRAFPAKADADFALLFLARMVMKECPRQSLEGKGWFQVYRLMSQPSVLVQFGCDIAKTAPLLFESLSGALGAWPLIRERISMLRPSSQRSSDAEAPMLVPHELWPSSPYGALHHELAARGYSLKEGRH
ncbi:hypothetical protein B0H03_10517 [Rathayibacter iranicus NCPPB 2253 = VKM Ac-1602]|uniref:Uncharacterized protein n=1 Tax=Rathayibacter iranicus NCPPB 2253 = VKM Ac-1602 TaxID=1328868 RepID=A0ABX5LFS9_9MICO|nr:hypothetical protein B0H03_10517 [Rathayibacter iranicus NCPPB 2253 = VKM Ac-1602]